MARPPTTWRAAAVLALALACSASLAPPARADWDSARKFFAENVKSPDWKTRRNAYGALQDHDGGPAAQMILASLATEANAAVVASAVGILGRMKSQTARAELLGVFRKGKSAERGMAAMALQTVKGAEVDAAFLDALASGPPLLAVAAATALGQPGRAPAAGPLVKALGHDAWQVRGAAARALGSLAEKSAVGPLADRLKVEKFRARAEVVRALEAITGRQLGDAPARWAAVAAGADPAVVEEKPTLPPTFFGAPVTGERVAIVLDRSLNMRDEHPLLGPENRDRLEALCTPADGDRIPWRTLKTKWQLAVAHLEHAVDGLPSGAKVEVVYYAEDVKGVHGLRLAAVGTAMRKALYAALDAIETDDGINIYGGLDAALDLGGTTDEKAFKQGPDQILWVTNNVPTKGEVAEADGILAAISLKARRRFVPVTAVGIGNHPFALAEGLAKQTGGVYVNLTK